MSKILIIDDDKDVLIAAEQYLQKNNEDVLRSFSSVPIVFLTKILTFLRNYTNINRFFMRSLLWLYVWKAMLHTACLAGIVE